jgi:NAD(P)-dependent dehydrogenase (short-subunit alcohol dehydrogenase family)
MSQGAVESLAHETTPFGLKTLVVEPGRFRTQLLSASNLKVKLPESRISDYAQYYAALDNIAAESNTQPGDPQKLASIVVDLVRGEGVVKNKKIPLRIQLGQDAWDQVGEHLRGTLGHMDEWESVIKSTDLDN